MRRIFLVDTENVNLEAMTGSNELNNDDLIILFVTDMTNICQFSNRNLNKLNTKANIVKIHVEAGRKNSLDFQLVSYLGFIIGEHKNENDLYYIVSKDKGFLSSINLLENCSNYKIELIPCINQVLNMSKIDMCEFLERAVSYGFKIKTARKIYITLCSKNDYVSVMNELKIVFNKNESVLNRCKELIKSYFTVKASA